MLLRKLTLITALALALPAGAEADTITSSNWSGYAIHAKDRHFRNVQATWTEPEATCATGKSSYSSFWVGIGGYALSSDALEQVGTELDCNADGSQTLTAWYELVPAPSRVIAVTVNPGDVITADVEVRGDHVTIGLADRTRNEYFVKTIVDHKIDTSSAEWITEAPSDCHGSKCSVLPLADFGAIDFTDATATSTTGAVSKIDAARWTTTRILLGYRKESGSFVARTTASAAPSTLDSSGTSFRVDYTGTAPTITPTTITTTTTAPTTTTTAPGAGSTAPPSGPFGGRPGVGPGGGPGGLTGGPGV